MPVGQLNVELRNEKGKNAAGRLRAQGKIPAICYGAGVDPIQISLDPVALKRALDPEKKHNTVITMKVAGKDGDLLVMLKDFQIDPLSSRLEHADFVQIKMDQEVRVTVPIELVGKPEGVKIGGLLNIVYRQLPLLAKPNAIPTKVSVNIEELMIGDAVHVSDIKLAEGQRALLDPGTAIASVVAPKAEVEEKPAAEAVPAEGAVAAAPGAPGAPGAAPGAPGAAPGAPGAAPGAAPAAAAPAAGEKKGGKK
jgi:large subunit ribosomal protein L25